MIDASYMTDKERLDELWQVLKRAYDILESFDAEKYDLLNNGAHYSPAKCIKWGLQGIGNLRCSNYYNKFASIDEEG